MKRTKKLTILTTLGTLSAAGTTFAMLPNIVNNAKTNTDLSTQKGLEASLKDSFNKFLPYAIKHNWGNSTLTSKILATKIRVAFEEFNLKTSLEHTMTNAITYNAPKDDNPRTHDKTWNSVVKSGEASNKHTFDQFGIIFYISHLGKYLGDNQPIRANDSTVALDFLNTMVRTIGERPKLNPNYIIRDTITEALSYATNTVDPDLDKLLPGLLAWNPFEGKKLTTDILIKTTSRAKAGYAYCADVNLPVSGFKFSLSFQYIKSDSQAKLHLSSASWTGFWNR